MPGCSRKHASRSNSLLVSSTGASRDGDLAGVAPQDDLARRQHVVLVALLRAAEDRLDPRRELARRERLRDVVVGADLEPRDAIGLLVARREHDDRHLRAGADAAADLEAVDSRQADVEHDEADRVLAQLGDRLLARPEPDDAPAVLLLEVLLDETTDRVVVLDEQENSPGGARTHAERISGGSAMRGEAAAGAALAALLDPHRLGGTAGRRPEHEHTPACAELTDRDRLAGSAVDHRRRRHGDRLDAPVSSRESSAAAALPRRPCRGRGSTARRCSPRPAARTMFFPNSVEATRPAQPEGARREPERGVERHEDG